MALFLNSERQKLSSQFGGKMIPLEQVQHARMLYKSNGLSIAEIARILGKSRNAVAAYIKDDDRGLRNRPPIHRSSKLDACPAETFKKAFLDARGNCEVLARAFQRSPQKYSLPENFTVFGSTIRRYVNKKYPELRQKPIAEAVQNFSINPGQQMQIDFVDAEYRLAGHSRPTKLKVFEATYSWSRKIFFLICPDEQQSSWLRGIAECMSRFGVPQSILCDNAKALVLSHRPGNPAVFSPAFQWLCKPLGITPRACRISAPNTKGRVERTGAYLKTSALPELQLDSDEIPDIPTLQRRLDEWVTRVADQRFFDNGTHQGTVEELYEVELSYLRFPKAMKAVLTVSNWVQRVPSDCLIFIHGTAVPLAPSFSGYTVEVIVRANGEYAVMTSRGDIVAEGAVPAENLQYYSLRAKPGNSSTLPAAADGSQKTEDDPSLRVYQIAFGECDE